MSAEHTEMPAVDPAAIDPTTTAHEASSDPIRPTGTDTLVPESRPELGETGFASEAIAGTESDMPNLDPAALGAATVEAQPIAAGNLGYKAPGLIK